MLRVKTTSTNLLHHLQLHLQKIWSYHWLHTWASSRLRSLRVPLIIVWLQDVPVLGNHEDWDEVDHRKSQKLSLLTVHLKHAQSYITYFKFGTSFKKVAQRRSKRFFYLFVFIILTISLKTMALRRLMSMSWSRRSRSLIGDMPPVTASTGLCAFTKNQTTWTQESKHLILLPRIICGTRWGSTTPF